MNAGGINGIPSQDVHGTQSTRDVVDGAEAKRAKLSIIELTHLTMMERSELLEHDMREQLEQMQQDNTELKQLSDIEAKLANMRTNTSSIDSPTWTVDRNASPTEIALDNGYVLEIPGEREEWVIRDANGNETRVWGDPHVDEGDLDGNKNWDFSADSTFILDDGTKIHVGTIDKERSNGQRGVFTDSLTITRGNQAIQVTGIAENDPQIREPNLNGARLDAETNDGHVFKMGDAADDWVHVQGDNREVGIERGRDNDVTSALGAISYEHSTGTDSRNNLNNVLTEDDRNLLKQLGINIFDNSGAGVLTPTEINNLRNSIKSAKDSKTSLSQLKLVDIQSRNSKFEQSNAMDSQMMKSMFSQAKEIIRNI